MAGPKLLYVGVKAVIYRKDKKILLLRVNKENDPSFRGDWDLPGGRLLENNQTVFERLMFKIKEETGIEGCKMVRLVAAGLVEQSDLFLVVYLLDLGDQGDKLATDRGHNEYDWVTPGEAASKLWQMSEELREGLRSLEI